MADKKATLNIGEATIELGVKSPTIGTDVIDVSTLGSKGYFTFDHRVYLYRVLRIKNYLYRW